VGRHVPGCAGKPLRLGRRLEGRLHAVARVSGRKRPETAAR
jgi:hypothetical protein